MTKLDSNRTDGAKEKHVPVIIMENGLIKVAVGSILHPMLPINFIEWIILATGETTKNRYLKPATDPKPEFTEASTGTIYECCNLHGLWKADSYFILAEEMSISAYRVFFD